MTSRKNLFAWKLQKMFAALESFVAFSVRALQLSRDARLLQWLVFFTVYSRKMNSRFRALPKEK